MVRVLATGGAGFIGTNLVNDLRNRGHARADGLSVLLDGF